MTLKLKARPEDFEVAELSDFALGDGPFATYLLTKRSLGTPEAITAIQQRWDLRRTAISYGGLKDKHAVTRQFVTIHRGPKRSLQQSHFTLDYQGQADRPFTAQDIAANRFTITLRGISAAFAERVAAEFPIVLREGVPNYFDDQRFGSLGESGEFIAQPWCQGNYERTLWLMLADPNVHDRPDDRQTKSLLRSRWGDWPALKAQLPKSSARSIVTFLCDHPTDFRRAVALVRQDLRSLYLAAFQSALWNELLATVIRDTVPVADRQNVPLDVGLAVFFSRLSEAARGDLQQLDLPLPSARLHFEDDDPRRPLYEQVLGRFGLTLRELRVKYPRDAFFSKGERRAVIVPRDGHLDMAPDELYPNATAVTMRFVLPRGAYATMVVKRLTEIRQLA